MLILMLHASGFTPPTIMLSLIILQEVLHAVTVTLGHT